MFNKDVRVGVLSVGTELTEGIIQDTHVRYLGSLLKSAGFNVEKAVIIPDNSEQFRQSLSELVSSTGIIINTGGLGPTSDDLTRDIIAEIAGVRLEFKSELWENIRTRFRNAEKALSNMRQAYIPEGFEVIPNPMGTAPGFYGTIRGSLIVALPGPPNELRIMFEKTVLPLLETRVSGGVAGELRGASFLIPESRLEDLFARFRLGNILWGTRIEEGRIAFILKGGTEDERRTMFDMIRNEVGDGLIRDKDAGIAELVFEQLRKRRLRLISAESCTGGMIGSMITECTGSSEVYWGGFVSYHNDAKKSMLGVSSTVLEKFGAVSEETVCEMAAGALRVSGADVSVAVSGIAGPGGGTPEKPVGTVWIAAMRAGRKPLSGRFVFSGHRHVVRMRAVIGAFLLVESAVLEKERLDSVVNSAYI